MKSSSKNDIHSHAISHEAQKKRRATLARRELTAHKNYFQGAGAGAASFGFFSGTFSGAGASALVIVASTGTYPKKR